MIKAQEFTLSYVTRDSHGQPLKSHELAKNAHVLVGQYNKQAGVITSDHILTSSKKNHITGQPNIIIDINNYQELGKSQRIAELQTSHLFLESNVGRTFVIKKDATPYMQRLHKDDPESYTEDGLLHSDDENRQRGPWPQNDVPTTNKDTKTPKLTRMPIPAPNPYSIIGDFNDSFPFPIAPLFPLVKPVTLSSTITVADELQLREKNTYFSLLSFEYQTLFKALSLFEDIQVKDKKLKEKKDKGLYMKQEQELFNKTKQLPEEPAKVRREAYLKNKQQAIHNE